MINRRGYSVTVSYAGDDDGCNHIGGDRDDEDDLASTALSKGFT